ncbi:metal-dependent hydrolase [Nitrosomonas sp. PY1]|uniref:M48 family metallopeptidase n=1 Tax=Nitrosomonas sp. PY1 TaxID=1803906 RepID=UPI001FC815CF|nr:SprT family zinc-dependent metalloprotease [Nitrosomonas sp. PY1]GKS68722.1 metal-dependent hydrolase [Nitrosomonas sp. PY1]
MSTDIATMRLSDLDVEVIHKNIKNVHLSVHPPDGRVKVSAPVSMAPDTVRVFVISKLGWIKKQQTKLRLQEREAPREYIDREIHYVWGKRYLLKLDEEDVPPSVELKHGKMILSVRPGTNRERRQGILEAWYRNNLKQSIPMLIEKWQPRMSVSVQRFYVQRMKTKWGSCNFHSGSIRINTELAMKPLVCLEYVVVHEMTHLLEPTHNSRFIALMDQFMPKWRSYREELNRLPARYEDWDN